MHRDAWPEFASDLMARWHAEWYLCSLQPVIRQVLLSLDDQEEVAEAAVRLHAQTLTDVQLRGQLQHASQRNPSTGYHRDCIAAIALGEELARRRTERAAVAHSGSSAGGIHEGGWDATQSLAFFRAHKIRGRLIGVRGRLGLELREYVCLTRCLDDSVVEFAHRILAKASHHNV